MKIFFKWSRNVLFGLSPMHTFLKKVEYVEPDI